jgi:hypothetical protein
MRGCREDLLLEALEPWGKAGNPPAGARAQATAGRAFLDQSGSGSLAGIFILATDTVDEAPQLVDTDPAVAAGRFTVEIVPWLGPKTLTRVLEP